ncbi:MAG TPA: PDZ domain-containing protein, partial [Kofleriaceae bacterium]|nr:PDZ domain-containing protein [Kofleriaceae bacterium]
PTWQASADLPPAWTERALTTEGDVLYVVGRTALPEASSAGLEAGLEAARQAATVLLLEQIEAELEGSPVHAFVAARTRRDAADARPAIAARFLTQHGQALALTRAEVATHKRESGTELYVRYRVPRAQVDAVRASYRATFKFRGLELALFFPVLETALHAEGQLIVIAVDRRSGAALAGVREGDVLLSVAGAPVTTLDSFRTTANNAWVNLEPRGRLSLEFESAGARKTVTLMKPAPQP